MNSIELFRKTIRNFRLHAWRLEGYERHSGEAFNLFFAGEDFDKNYFSNLAYTVPPNEIYLGRLWLWDVLKHLRAPHGTHHMSILGINNRLRRWCGKHAFSIPCWIRGEAAFVDIACKIETSQHINADLRRIRNNNLSYVVTKEIDAFRDFYHRMYRPHTTLPHGNEAVFHTLNAVMERAERSELLLIKRGEDIIAGEIIAYENQGPEFWCNGVVDGNREFVKAGALAALYYYRYIHLSAQGYSSVHMGASRAFLKDGVLQFKKKWGMRLTETHDTRFLIEIRQATAGLRSFLKNNPYLCEDGGEYLAIVFIETLQDLGEDEIKRMYKDLALPGTSKLVFYTFDEVPDQAHIPQDLANDIEVRRANTVIPSL